MQCIQNIKPSDSPPRLPAGVRWEFDILVLCKMFFRPLGAFQKLDVLVLDNLGLTTMNQIQ